MAREVRFTVIIRSWPAVLWIKAVRVLVWLGMIPPEHALSLAKQGAMALLRFKVVRVDRFGNPLDGVTHWRSLPEPPA